MPEDPKYTVRRILREYVERGIDRHAAESQLVALGVESRSARRIIRDLTDGSLSQGEALAQLGY